MALCSFNNAGAGLSGTITVEVDDQVEQFLQFVIRAPTQLHKLVSYVSMFLIKMH